MHQTANQLAQSMARWCRDASTIYAACKNEYSTGIPTRSAIEAMIAEHRTAQNDDEPEKGDDGWHWRPTGLVKPEKPVKIKAVRRSRAKPKRNRDYIFVPQVGPNPFLRRPGRAMSVCASVARDYGLTLDDLIGACRIRHIAKARFVCYRLLRNLGLSTPHIGRILDKDHSTVVHGLQRFDAELERDEFLARVYRHHEKLRQEIDQALAA